MTARPWSLALALVALAVPACSSSGGGNCEDLSDRGDTLTLRIDGFAFEPSCFTAGIAQGIEVLNEDGAVHSFTLEGTPIDMDVPAEGKVNVPAVAGGVEPGTYDLICTYHPEMTGTVTFVG